MRCSAAAQEHWQAVRRASAPRSSHDGLQSAKHKLREGTSHDSGSSQLTQIITANTDVVLLDLNLRHRRLRAITAKIPGKPCPVTCVDHSTRDQRVSVNHLLAFRHWVAKSAFTQDSPATPESSWEGCHGFKTRVKSMSSHQRPRYSTDTC